MSIQSIEPKQLYELMLSGARRVDLIDVRTPAEYHEVHAERARLMPLDALDPEAVMAGRVAAKAEPLYVICRSGARSWRACDAFLSAGFGNVVNVAGGTSAWEDAGLPVVREKLAVSLANQVWVGRSDHLARHLPGTSRASLVLHLTGRGRIGPVDHGHPGR